jgi:hypothetical protein
MRMRRRLSKRSSPENGYVGDHADKLGHVRPMTHDEDERPSREDRDYGSTVFTRPPVPLPRFSAARTGTRASRANETAAATRHASGSLTGALADARCSS